MPHKQRRQSSTAFTRALHNFGNYIPPLQTPPSTSSTYFQKRALPPSPVEYYPPPSAKAFSKMPSRPKPSSAAPFRPGPVAATVSFPPYEMAGRDTSLTREERNFLLSEWQRFRVEQYTDPSNLIGNVAYMVPYNGNGQSGPTLEDLTGKKRFNFFAYKFSVPDTDEEWAIMWDYETGLVRTAGMFKPLEHVKSAPKMALECSDGLLKIAANVNGGRVDIQGYWVPFKAAFELCTKFAYDLRAVLYPLFGPEILRKCLPRNHPDFLQFAIRPSTVQICKQELLQLPRPASPAAASSSSANVRSTPAGPRGPSRPRPKRQAKSKKVITVDTDEESIVEYSASDASSAYGSRADSPPLSPKSLPTPRDWTPVNNRALPSPTSTSPSVASIQATAKRAKKQPVKRQATIPRSTPVSEQSTSRAPKRPTTATSQTSDFTTSSTSTGDSTASYIPTNQTSAYIGKGKGKKRATDSPDESYATDDTTPRLGKRARQEEDRFGNFTRMAPPKQPSQREWNDIKLRQFLKDQAQRVDSSVSSDQGPIAGPSGSQRKGGKMHMSDLKAAIGLLELSKGRTVADWDDADVLAEAVRLRHVRMRDLREIEEGERREPDEDEDEDER
ncbi:hypothetical protein CAC42_2239 [Sphaceloma murrayae]|uniref:HTH APSES-type domain-containing protein n=1 Tax=Sphaceloma murrayae TaxID=2082308 RepID=A0A2K1QJD3_9PEZI|nr:hypothetical protein CAC42_2239 [Sphaceloma murrayae]